MSVNVGDQFNPKEIDVFKNMKLLFLGKEKNYYRGLWFVCK